MNEILQKLSDEINYYVNTDCTPEKLRKALYSFALMQHGKGRRQLGEANFNALKELLSRDRSNDH